MVAEPRRDSWSSAGALRLLLLFAVVLLFVVVLMVFVREAIVAIFPSAAFVAQHLPRRMTGGLGRETVSAASWYRYHGRLALVRRAGGERMHPQSREVGGMCVGEAKFAYP